MLRIETSIPQKISTNKYYRLHWRKQHKVNEIYFKYFPVIIKEQQIKSVKNFPVEITYLFTFKGKVLDSLNLTAMAKLIEDSLVQNDILPDDSPKYVSMSTLIPKKGNEDKVEILII